MAQFKFQYRKRQVLLQRLLKFGSKNFIPVSFNTVNGRCYCNVETSSRTAEKFWFQYRKRQVLLQQRTSEGQYSWGLKLGFGKPHTVNSQIGLPFDQKCL